MRTMSTSTAPLSPDEKAVKVKNDGLLEYLIIHYRWVFVCFFLLPLSLVYDMYFYFRSWIVFRLKSAPKRHNFKVKHVQRQVKAWRADGMQKTMCTARPGWQTMSLRVGKYKRTSYPIHLDLVDILEVNVDEKKVIVEPLVTMGQMTATLLPLGWTLPVVPELDDLTAGGMINGTGVESSSHIYGLFQHTCLAYEVVLHDGSLVRCSKVENTELFYSIPWSHGTLGFVVSAELRIVPCKPYVQLEYVPLRTSSAVCDAFIAAAKGQPLTSTSSDKDGGVADFIEALMFSKESGVLLRGRMTEYFEPDKVNRVGKFHKPWFYSHAEKFLASDQERAVEYIPLRDYYSRHTRSLFWEMQDIIPFGNWAPFRFLLGWTMPPKVSFLKLTQGETIRQLYEKHQFIQDLFMPVNNLKEFLDFADKTVKIYPVWLCPVRLFQHPGMVHPRTDDDMYVDVGLYGVPQVKGYEAMEVTRNVEARLTQIKGFKMLYADTYMTEAEFRLMYDHTLYDQVRKKLDCKKAFPEVYQKISKEARH